MTDGGPIDRQERGHSFASVYGYCLGFHSLLSF